MPPKRQREPSSIEEEISKRRRGLAGPVEIGRNLSERKDVSPIQRPYQLSPVGSAVVVPMEETKFAPTRAQTAKEIEQFSREFKATAPTPSMSDRERRATVRAQQSEIANLRTRLNSFLASASPEASRRAEALAADMDRLRQSASIPDYSASSISRLFAVPSAPAAPRDDLECFQYDSFERILWRSAQARFVRERASPRADQKSLTARDIGDAFALEVENLTGFPFQDLPPRILESLNQAIPEVFMVIDRAFRENLPGYSPQLSRVHPPLTC